jgi:eukaryotic-like serine/threonine-protein kinase
VDSALSVGRYGIDEWLASGTMGVVFRGYDRALDRPVAIKILRRELAKGSAAAEWQERFRRRARVAARLFHPNIPTVFDFAEDQEIPFIAMEYIDGLRLDRLLETSGRFAADRAAALMFQVLDALQYSHESGVVHLDLNSSVIFALPSNQVKVADFGVTLGHVEEETDLSECAAATPYMAPEQLARAAVDHRADLFAAGALLFEMLTGGKPFRLGSTEEIVDQIARRGPEDVCTLNPGVPAGFRDIIGTALAYDPGLRFATAGEFSLALRDAVSSRDGAETGVGSLSASRAPMQHVEYDQETLRKLETDLAARIGPVAAIAVQRAVKRADDLVSLCELLAAHIKDDRERDEFLRHGLRLNASFDSGPAAQKDPAADLPDRDILDGIELELTHYLGPIAKLLLTQQMRNFESLPKLYGRLASYIADESERVAFLHSARVRSNRP